MPDSNFTLTPIGYVRNSVEQPLPTGWDDVDSVIDVAPEHEAGLLALDGFSHLIVLSWLHLLPNDQRLVGQAHLMGRDDLPTLGTFATRSPRRPNPLGIAIVLLLGVEGTKVTVRGLDAVNGTPILDIKPYLPPYDAPGNVQMPSWVWGRS